MDESYVLLKEDFRNGFNTMRRDHILKIVKEQFPALYSFTWQAYSLDSHLFYGESRINSASGLQQGDPLGTFLYFLLACNR